MSAFAQGRRASTRLRLICWMLGAGLGLCGTTTLAQEVAQDPAQSDAPLISISPADKGPDLTARSQKALESIDALTGEVAAVEPLDALATRVRELADRIHQLLPEGQDIDTLIGDDGALDGTLLRSRGLSEEADAITSELAKRAEQIESTLAKVRSLQTDWQTIKAQSVDLPPALNDRIRSILERSDALKQQAKHTLNSIVSLQNSTLDMLNVITPVAEKIHSYDLNRQAHLLEANAPPIWQLSRNQLATSTERSGRRFVSDLQQDMHGILRLHGPRIGAHLILLPLVLFLMMTVKRSSDGSDASELNHPLATGLLIWMLLGIAIYTAAPSTVRTLYVMTAMITAVIVLMPMLPTRIRGGIYGFVAIAIIERLISILPIVDHMPRLIYLLLGLAMAGVAGLGYRAHAAESIAQWGVARRVVRSAIVVSVTISMAGVLMNVLGYLMLAKLLVGGVVRSTAVFLVLFTGLATISAVVRILLALPSVSRIRSIARNRTRLDRTLRRALQWLALLIWLWATAVIFQLDTIILGSLGTLITAELTIGDATLSLRDMLLFALAVWLAVWASRVVRAVLNDDVLPRMNLPRGVPNTISMSVHYSIIMLGLLLGFSFLSISLSSLAFIVGALGVGIGFGLQNVVNNFVSGLILIFEAPIQVGDTVEVGALMGKVTQIGIRTSRVRTFSGSEVIVPNGDLVSNQVINWTLTDRRRRLELPVGVAYGTDPDQVTALLTSIVQQDEDILNSPAPFIVFEEFGDSALSFRIYAWIGDFDRGLEVRHKLNIKINNALKAAGIEIPFPQRDLHVRTLPTNPGPSPTAA